MSLVRWERLISAFLSLAVHALFLGLLVLSLEFAEPALPVSAGQQPIEAVVLDQIKVEREVARLRESETRENKRQTQKTKAAEKRLALARKLTKLEEEKLATMQRLREQRQRREDEAARRLRDAENQRLKRLKREHEAEARRLAEVKKAKNAAVAAKTALEQETKAIEAKRLRIAAEAKKAELQRRESVRERKRVEQLVRQAKNARQEEERKQREMAEARRQVDRLAAIAKKKRLEQEAAAKAAEENRLKAEEVRKVAEHARARAAEALAIKRQIAAEEEQLERRRHLLLDKGRREYSARIKAAVRRRWKRPPGLPPRLRCTVMVEQTKSGEVVKVSIQESSGDVAFDRSVERAVRAASPLPRPADPVLFDSRILFNFRAPE